jgi:hypothetical protein
MIQQGHLPAQKVGCRWVIERAALPVEPEAQQRASVKQARFQAALEDALLPGGKDRRIPCTILRRYSWQCQSIVSPTF